MKYFSFLLLSLSLASAAHADEAFSNLDPAPNSYSSTLNRVVGIGSVQPHLIQGTQFTSTASGIVSSISVAMNNYQTDIGTMAPFTLKLYANSASDQLGTLLGSYSALSTGLLWFGTSDALVEVAAGSPSVTLASGTKYWLVAEGAGNSSLAWSVSNRTTVMNHLTMSEGDTVYTASAFSDAFAVHVTPVPEPATLAALGLGLTAFLRRRK